MTISKEEWLWRRWRLGEGEFKEFGPANTAKRPTNIPLVIPKEWWDRLRVFLKNRADPPNASNRRFLSGRGALVRAPGGNIEQPEQWKELQLEYLAFNIGDYQHNEYNKLRYMCDNNGMDYFPWRRCYSKQDVQALITVADSWCKKIIGLNVENELDEPTKYGHLPPLAIAEATREWERMHGGHVIDIFLGWIQNSPDCTPISHHTCMLEIFPLEAPNTARWQDCVLHARNKGFSDIELLFGTHPISGTYHTPDLYPMNVPHWLYTFDDLGPRWKEWVI